MNTFSLRMLGVILVAALGVVSSARAAFADPHLPIIDITPESTWAGASDAKVNPGAGIGVVSGPITINGTATLPLFKGLSFSYDRINGDVFYNTLTTVPIGGQNVAAGSYDDVVQNYRLDYELNRSIAVELAESTRQRVCCPAASSGRGIEWHIGSLGLTYTTPYFKPIHGLFVLNVTGHANYHNPDPATAASWGGLDIACTSVSRTEAGAVCNDYKAVTTLQVSEAATYVLPLDPRGGFVMTATYLNGSGDYFTQFPYPDRYNITVFGAEKHFTPNVALKLGVANVWQEPQGTPFPLPGAIHLVSYTAGLDFHLDFNKLLAAPAKH